MIWALKPTLLERKEAERPDLGPHYEARKFLLALFSSFGLQMLAGASARHSRKSSFDCSPHTKDTEAARRQTCGRNGRRIWLISLLSLSIYIYYMYTHTLSLSLSILKGHVLNRQSLVGLGLVHPGALGYAKCFSIEAGWTWHRRIFCQPSWEAIGHCYLIKYIFHNICQWLSK